MASAKVLAIAKRGQLSLGDAYEQRNLLKKSPIYHIRVLGRAWEWQARSAGPPILPDLVVEEVLLSARSTLFWTPRRPSVSAERGSWFEGSVSMSLGPSRQWMRSGDQLQHCRF
mmetsp:Transcript_104255/g.334411  ORF Transcript_104255/g.334411 Transcript_104255/m.334411 type:complete len:114 (+) Transcript_104255:334-675(+)